SGDLTNHGLIKVTSGTSNSIHDVSDFINDGELRITGAGTKLLLSNETVDNAGGLISISSNGPLDPSVLELQNAIIASGDVANHGLISVTSGASNSIHDLSDFTNDGELRVTGSGTELQLSNETVKNTDGTIYVGLGATLDLTAVTVAGGSL